MIKAKSYKPFCVFLGFCLLYSLGRAQSILSIRQNYFVKNFSKKELGVSSQSWCAVQDIKGQVYIANNHGILINNGQQWRDVILTMGADARSLDVDKQGRIFVGGKGEIGYLYYDKRGKTRFASLNHLLDEKEKHFSDVWTTICLEDGTVYFQSHEFLFLIKDGKKIASFESETGFHKSFKIGNIILVRENERGLKILEDNKLKSVEGGEYYHNLKIDGIVPVNSDRFLMVGRGFGLQTMRLTKMSGNWGIEFKSINSELGAELKTNQVYHAAKNPNGGYVLSTLLNGVYFLDENFNLVSILNKSNELADNKIFYLYFDINKNLWLATESGVSFVETSLPLSYWGELEGLEGIGQDLLVTDKQIYVATGLGLYRFTNKNNFEKIKGSPIEVWSLLEWNNSILVGASSGLYLFKDNKIQMINDLNTHYLGVKPSGELVQAGEGFVNLFSPNDLYKAKKVYDFYGLAQQVYFNKQGMWVATRDDGVIFFNMKDEKISLEKNSRGIDVDAVSFFELDKTTFIAGSGGIYKPKFIAGKLVFEPYILDSKIDTAAKFNIFKLSVSPKNEIAFIADYEGGKQEMYYFVKGANGFIDKSKILTRVSNGRINKILFKGETLWMLGDDGLFEYYTNKDIPNNTFFPIIDKVISNSDTLCFGNFPHPNDSSLLHLQQSEKFFNELSYDHHVYKIVFSATSFIDNDHTLYSYYLEGFDNGFSGWLSEPFRTYTNIKEGKYVFHLKAKDVYGNYSPETTFTFYVLPPWYRTWPAYILYFVLTLSSIYSIVQLNIKRLKKKNLQLEAIIEERTTEIRHQKNEIEAQKKEITDSINYAKRIQGAVMPSREQLMNDFKNSFVLFMPKDIVSGDFFYLTKLEKEGKKLDLIAAADCTGHGVPGAFMSMIGLKTLEQAIYDFNETEPDKILYRLNAGVNSFLRQNINKTHDGMEIALCVFDYESLKLKFAMANRPLWLIRQGELIEYKPTKLGVGGVQEERLNEYKLNEIDLIKGDSIYIFSDGFADQFGGPEGKKLMNKRFKEELLKVSLLPINNQRAALKKFMETWKGSYEQVDDILVIGVRV